jgi:hypothetical protein
VGDYIAFDVGITSSSITCFVNDTYIGGVIDVSPNVHKKESGWGVVNLDFGKWEFIVAAWK